MFDADLLCYRPWPHLKYLSSHSWSVQDAQVYSLRRSLYSRNSQCSMTDLALAYQELGAIYLAGGGGESDMPREMGPEQVAYGKLRCPETGLSCSQALGPDLPCSEQGLAHVSNRAPKNASSKSFGAGPFTSPSRSRATSEAGTVRTQPALPYLLKATYRFSQ